MLSPKALAFFSAAIVFSCVAGVIGGRLQLISFVVAMTSATFFATAFIKAVPKARRQPYRLLQISAGFLTVGVVCSEFLQPTAFGQNGLYVTPALDCIFLFVASAADNQIASRKSSMIDRTAFVDAVLISLGVGTVVWVAVTVPAFQSSAYSLSAKIVFFCILSLQMTLFGSIVRLVLSLEIHDRSFNFYCGGSALFLLGNIFATKDFLSSGISFTPLALVTLSIGGLFVAASGLSATVAFWEQPRFIIPAKMTRFRLAVTTSVVILPFCIVIANPGEVMTCMGVGVLGLASAVFVSFRLLGLQRTHAEELQHESIISRNAIAMTTAVERHGMYTSALGAILEVCGADTRAAVFALRKEEWKFQVELPVVGQLQQIGLENLQEGLKQLRGASRRHDFSLAPREFGEPGHEVWVIPMMSRRILQGVIVITGCKTVAGKEAALERIVCDLAIAEQSADVSEIIHKTRSEKRLRSLVSQAQDLAAIVKDDGTFSYISPAVESILGRREIDLINRSLLELFDDANADNIRRVMMSLNTTGAKVGVTEVEFEHPNNGRRSLELSITDLREDEMVHGFVLNARDTTEQKALESDLRHRASFDELTGIPNRALFSDYLSRSISRNARTESKCAVVTLDLDDFKTVNDALGYPNGDEIIRIMAFRLNQYVREHDTICRLGGDEFAVLLEDVASENEAVGIASRMLEVIEEPIQFDEREVAMTAGIGVAMSTDDCDPSSLLRNADVAMYRAKERGKGTVVLFDESMHRSAVERLDLKSDLTKALNRDQLSLHYQPIVNLHGDLLGFEALMRWRHPARGFVSPANFIPLAEESGLIVAMGDWALRTATEQLGIWQREFDCPTLSVSVNVSPRQLYSPGLLENVKGCVRHNAIDPASLIVELTESELVDDTVASETLNLLRKVGVGIAADDFGSGFASYAALAQLPFTIVKMDRSLIQNLTEPNSNSHAQVRSIIEMAHGIGIQVTAEGIEESTQRDALLAMNCDKAQGYWFAKPMPSDEATQYLARARIASHDRV